MITKLELIEYLKHTPENTNYNILYSSLYNGSNKEAVDEFIEVLSRGNLSLAALQPYLAKLYEDDKTISPEPLPPFSVGGAQPDWNQNDATAADYVKNRPGGYMSDPAYNEVFNGTLGGEALEAPCIFTSGDIVKVTIDGEEKDYTVVEEEVEGTTIYRVGTDPYINVLTGSVANGFAIATFTMGVDAIISAASGTYTGKTAVVKANVAMPIVIPAKFLPPKESDVIAIRLEKTGNNYATCSRSDYHKIHDAIDNGKEVILILSGGIDPANGWYRYSENKDDGMHFVRITDYGGCYMNTLVNTRIDDNFAFFKFVESRAFVTTNDKPGSAAEDGKMLVVKNG